MSAAVHVPAFVVVGGGSAGVFYVRQLRRAVAAGWLRTGRVVVVDRDPACPASAHAGGFVSVETADWSDWLDSHLEGLGPESHLVPYHWAPHLLVEWLARRARQAGLQARVGGAVPGVGVPFERETTAGDRALSYATWPCPPACIEPALCPHTRTAKDWSLIADLQRPPAGRAFDGAVVFPSLHLVFGVGTIPVGEVQAAGRRVVDEAGGRRRRYLVATSSHCHALASVLEAGPPAGVC